jgi:putative flippase GtrA
VTLIAALARHPFIRFGMVGAGGYVVDTAVLALDTHFLGLDPYSGRAVSIFVAMTFTWLGNRTLTFPEHAARGSAGAITQEWLKFIGANIVGAVVNYGTYAILVAYAPAPLGDKYVALICGVLAGLVFNFTLSKKLVFRKT